MKTIFLFLVNLIVYLSIEQILVRLYYNHRIQHEIATPSNLFQSNHPSPLPTKYNQGITFPPLSIEYLTCSMAKSMSDKRQQILQEARQLGIATQFISQLIDSIRDKPQDQKVTNIFTNKTCQQIINSASQSNSIINYTLTAIFILLSLTATFYLKSLIY